MTVDHASKQTSLTARMRRTASLIRKEARQMVRDPSSVAIGIVLPVVLILLFGYGLSLDVNNVPVAVVLEDSSPEATALAASFQLSEYFDARMHLYAARTRTDACPRWMAFSVSVLILPQLES
jgi:ABC-2 type transport system permease protein